MDLADVGDVDLDLFNGQVGKVGGLDSDGLGGGVLDSRVSLTLLTVFN